MSKASDKRNFVNQYQVLEKIGEGRFGNVYKVTEERKATKKTSTFAMKVILRKLLGTDLINEIKVLK